MSNTRKPLSDAELNLVSGGYLFNSSGMVTSDRQNEKNPIELLDNKGNIMKDANNRELRFSDMQSAITYANANNINTTQVDWNWVCGARGQAPS